MAAPDVRPLVLTVDDDEEIRTLVGRWLERAAFRVETHASAETLIQGLKRTLPHAICLDLGLPGMGGLEALTLIRRRHRTVPVIILTADTSVDSVVTAMQGGAFDYVLKPPDRTKLLTTVRNAIDRYRMSTRLAQLEREVSGQGFGRIVGRSAPMREVFRQLERVAVSDITVLIHGESGTGKELVAHAIHENSPRSEGPFVPVNCAAVPETLQDSEFFGHEKGAFTGAHQKKLGRFEQAHGGTLFLDEVAELAPGLQAKLLRVLQERTFERVGGTRSIESDFRLVAASHRDLAKMAQVGTFRADLYFRIAVFELELPPLRDRPGDLSLLVDALLDRVSAGTPTDSHRLSPETARLLERYPWPGNVRELHNTLQRACVIAEDGIIQPADLPARIRAPMAEPRARSPSAAAGSSDAKPPAPTPPANAATMSLEELERWAIVTAMERSRGNVSEVIRRLGIGRTTLYRKLKQYGLR